MARGNGRGARLAIAAVLLLIPTIIYFDVPFYNVIYPEVGGLPFFYWFQIAMLPVSAVLFLVAAYLIDKK